MYFLPRRGKIFERNYASRTLVAKLYEHIHSEISWKFSVKKTVMCVDLIPLCTLRSLLVPYLLVQTPWIWAWATFLAGKNGEVTRKRLNLIFWSMNLPDTMITSRTELLTDVKIANVGCEAFKAFKAFHIPSSELNGFTLELNTCSFKTVKISLECDVLCFKHRKLSLVFIVWSTVDCNLLLFWPTRLSLLSTTKINSSKFMSWLYFQGHLDPHSVWLVPMWSLGMLLNPRVGGYSYDNFSLSIPTFSHFLFILFEFVPCL